eukprot:440885_1
MANCCRKFIPVWIQLIIWHIFCFGIFICLIRFIFMLLSIIFGGFRRTKQHFTYLRYELYPINRVLIYTHKYEQRDYCAIGCIYCQMFFTMPIMIISIPSALLCLIFTCGIFLKYHAQRVETGVLGLEYQYGYDVIHEDDLPNAKYHNKLKEWKKRYAHKKRPPPPPDFNEYAESKYIKNKYKAQKSIEEKKKDNMRNNLQLSTEQNEIVEIIENKNVKQWFQQHFDAVYYNNYYTLFMANGLDTMEIITATTMDDLVSIGIKKLGHRKKIMIEINKLNRNENVNEGGVVDEGRGQQITYV